MNERMKEVSSFSTDAEALKSCPSSDKATLPENSSYDTLFQVLVNAAIQEASSIWNGESFEPERYMSHPALNEECARFMNYDYDVVTKRLNHFFKAPSAIVDQRSNLHGAVVESSKAIFEYITGQSAEGMCVDYSNAGYWDVRELQDNLWVGISNEVVKVMNSICQNQITADKIAVTFVSAVLESSWCRLTNCKFHDALLQKISIELENSNLIDVAETILDEDDEYAVYDLLAAGIQLLTGTYRIFVEYYGLNSIDFNSVSDTTHVALVPLDAELTNLEFPFELSYFSTVPSKFRESKVYQEFGDVIRNLCELEYLQASDIAVMNGSLFYRSLIHARHLMNLSRLQATGVTDLSTHGGTLEDIARLKPFIKDQAEDVAKVIVWMEEHYDVFE